MDLQDVAQKRALNSSVTGGRFNPACCTSEYFYLAFLILVIKGITATANVISSMAMCLAIQRISYSLVIGEGHCVQVSGFLYIILLP